MDGVVIFIANYVLYISVVVTIYAWLKLSTEDRKQFIIQALLAAVTTILLAKLASWAYYNPRPFVVGRFDPLFPHPNNNGFPSDHTLFTSYLALLVFCYSRKIGVCLFALAVAIGAARVVAGVHHIVDIVAAFVVTGIAVTVSYFVIKHIQKEKVLKV